MKELMQNERSKAGITLALWGVFILFVFLLVSCSSSNGKGVKIIDNEPEVDTNSTAYKFNTLLHSNYGFKMTIEANDLSKKRIYDSSFISKDDKQYEGYVEDENGINRFRCDTTCYKVFLDHEEEEKQYYEELINNIDYLDKQALNITRENSTTYSYKDKDKTIKVYVDEDKNITKAVIEKEAEKVTLDINYNKNA